MVASGLSRFIVGLCFLTSKKEDNTVKLRQYVEITITDLFKRDAFRLYRDWKKLMINQ